MFGGKDVSRQSMHQPLRGGLQKGPRRKNDWVGKAVRIISGNDKGLTGIVVEGGTDTIVRVEINARNRILSIARSSVKELETETITHDVNSYNPLGQDHYAAPAYHPPHYASSTSTTAAGNPFVPVTPMFYQDQSSPQRNDQDAGSNPMSSDEVSKFNKGDEVKLIDTGESVKVHQVVGRDVVIIDSNGKYRIAAAGNLVYA